MTLPKPDDMPRFSILIPTRDRPDWLRLCLESILCQNFDDYEVIVADNSSPGRDNETKSVVESANSTKVHYIRTGGLSMPDNWQRALREAKGEYFLVLSDKLIAAAGLLAFLEDRIQSDGFDAAVWRIGREDQLSSLSDRQHIKPEIVSGRNIWQAACEGLWSILHKAGARGMNSCVRADVVARVEKQLGINFFRATTPDYSMALSLAALDFSSHFYNFIGAGFIAGADGNGMFCLMAPDEAAVAGRFAHPPVKNLPLPFAHGTNLIYQDIVALNGLLEPDRKCSVHWENYFIQNIHAAIDADDLGGFSLQRKNILLDALTRRPLRARFALAKIILCQETEVLLRGRRLSRKYQFGRLCRLMSYPLQALIPQPPCIPQNK